MEFTLGADDENYEMLTSMLHWRPDTNILTVGDLDQIYNKECYSDGSSENQGQLIINLIHEAAQDCINSDSGLNLENKVVLSIAIRVFAERLITKKLNSTQLLNEIQENQTHELITMFKNEFPEEIETAEIFDRVALMTPENIHLNSFMYEPIIDLGEDHLRKLYDDVLALN